MTNTLKIGDLIQDSEKDFYLLTDIVLYGESFTDKQLDKIAILKKDRPGWANAKYDYYIFFSLGQKTFSLNYKDKFTYIPTVDHNFYKIKERYFPVFVYV
jgi:hypothetical protein